MKLIYQFTGIVYGLILGLLSLISTVSIFFLWLALKYPETITKYDRKKGEEKLQEDMSHSPLLEALLYKYDKRNDAIDALSAMQTLVNQKGRATISDLKTYLELPTVFGDGLIGWTDLKNVEAKWSANKYVIYWPDTRKFDA